MMTDAATIKFRDAESSEEAVAMVRYDEHRVAVCLSLKTNGDVEAVMSKADAQKLLEALKVAVG